MRTRAQSRAPAAERLVRDGKVVYVGSSNFAGGTSQPRRWALQNSADGLVEPGYVIERELSSCVTVTVGDGFEKFGVVADVLGEVGHLVDHQAPDPRGEVVVADQHLLKVRVSGGPVDQMMDRHVLAEEHVAVAVGQVEVANVFGRGRSSAQTAVVAFSAARRAAWGSRSWRMSEMAPSSVTSTTVAKVPRRE